MWELNFEWKFLNEGLKVVELRKSKLLIIEWESNSYEFEVKSSKEEDRDEWVFIYELVGIEGLGIDEEYTYCVWDNESESLWGLNSYLSMLVWLYENNELDENLGWFIENGIQDKEYFHGVRATLARWDVTVAIWNKAMDLLDNKYCEKNTEKALIKAWKQAQELIHKENTPEKKKEIRKEWEFIMEKVWRFETNYHIIRDWVKKFLCQWKISFEPTGKRMTLWTSRWEIGNHIFIDKLTFWEIPEWYSDLFNLLIESIGKWDITVEEAQRQMNHFIKNTDDTSSIEWEIEEWKYLINDSEEGTFILDMEKWEINLSIPSIIIMESKWRYTIHIQHISWDNKSDNLIWRYFCITDRNKEKAVQKLIRQINRSLKSNSPSKKLYKDFILQFSN